MNLPDEMKAAAAHLKKALAQTQDWRVRDALANAASLVECARFLQKRIMSGEEVAQPQEPPSGP